MKLNLINKVALLLLTLSVAAFSQTTATVTVLGGEQSSGSVWDSGDVTIQINSSLSRTVSYGQFSTPQSVAAGLAALISRECYGVASAKADGATITFHLRYADAASLSIIPGVSHWDSSHFANPSFSFSQQQTVSASQVTLVGDTGELVGANSSVNLSATIVEGSPGGRVDLFDRGALVSSVNATNNRAPFPVVTVAAGAHEFYAKYVADSGYAGSTSNTVYVTATGHSGPAIGTNLYWYNITDGSGTGYSNNGNILAYTDAVMGQWRLGYDVLDRLTSGNAQSGPIPSQNGSFFCWSYDSFGNRLSQSVANQSFSVSNSGETCQAGGGLLAQTWANYDSHNRITETNAPGRVFDPQQVSSDLTGDGGYDPAGNIGDDGRNKYLYDAEGRICAAKNEITGQMEEYVYDAEDRRVGKGTISSWSCNLAANGFVQTAAYIIGADGTKITELARDSNGSLTWQHTNVAVSGKAIATYQNDNGGESPETGSLHFALTDWLGTKRMQTSHDGTIESSWTNLPFGDVIPAAPLDADESHFTGKDRDSLTGLDNFGARYYNSVAGRFVRPDPSGLYFSDPSVPQSLNLYSYAQNNPLRNTDANGLFCYYGNTDVGSAEYLHDHEDPMQYDYHSNSNECAINGGQWTNDYYTHQNNDGSWQDDEGRPEMYTMAGPQSLGSNTLITPTTGVRLFQDLVGTGVAAVADISFAPINALIRVEGGSPEPLLRLFLTNYCGPGGAGQARGPIDKACKVHDACYEVAKVDASVNTTQTSSMTPAQVDAVRACNQALTNAAANNPNAPGAAALKLWLSGAVRPFGYRTLYPGTEVTPR